MSISRRVDQLVVDENFVECPEDVPVGWNPISETETEAKMNLRFIATFFISSETFRRSDENYFRC